MRAKIIFSCALLTAILSLSPLRAQYSGSPGPGDAPPPVPIKPRDSGQPQEEMGHAPGLSSWITYHRDGFCDGPMGDGDPIMTEVVLRSGFAGPADATTVGLVLGQREARSARNHPPDRYHRRRLPRRPYRSGSPAGRLHIPGRLAPGMELYLERRPANAKRRDELQRPVHVWNPLLVRRSARALPRSRAPALRRSRAPALLRSRAPALPRIRCC